MKTDKLLRLTTTDFLDTVRSEEISKTDMMKYVKSNFGKDIDLLKSFYNDAKFYTEWCDYEFRDDFYDEQVKILKKQITNGEETTVPYHYELKSESELWFKEIKKIKNFRSLSLEERVNERHEFCDKLLQENPNAPKIVCLDIKYPYNWDTYSLHTLISIINDEINKIENHNSVLNSNYKTQKMNKNIKAITFDSMKYLADNINDRPDIKTIRERINKGGTDQLIKEWMSFRSRCLNDRENRESYISELSWFVVNYFSIDSIKRVLEEYLNTDTSKDIYLNSAHSMKTLLSYWMEENKINSRDYKNEIDFLEIGFPGERAYKIEKYILNAEESESQQPQRLIPDESNINNQFHTQYTKEELKSIFERLKEHHYIHANSDLETWLYVCGAIDAKEEIGHIEWIKDQELLADLINNLFGDSDGTRLWIITEKNFTIRGKAPNIGSMKNAISKINNYSKGKTPKFMEMEKLLSLSL